MAADMTIDYFADTEFGKAALKKMQPVPENFRLCMAEAVDVGVMRVTGAQFRKAQRGPHKGKFSVIVPGTQKTVYVDLKMVPIPVSNFEVVVDGLKVGTVLGLLMLMIVLTVLMI